MLKKHNRIIIDTNIWISFLISKRFSEFNEIIFSGKFRLVFSQDLLLELVEVVQRPKFKKSFSENNIDGMLELINGYAEFVKVKTNVTICRDPKDDFLLSLAIDGNVDYLISGDKDLLDLKLIKKTKILTVAIF